MSKKNKNHKESNIIKQDVSPETEVSSIIEEDVIKESNEDIITSSEIADNNGNNKDTSKLWKIFDKGPKTTLIGRGAESKIIGPVEQEVGEYIEI